jgi:hypothetical protein
MYLIIHTRFGFFEAIIMVENFSIYMVQRPAFSRGLKH